jgi:hypothetical protein
MEHSALGEYEDELEGGHEGEEFFGGLARRAAQAVLGSLGGQGDGEYEDEYELEGEEEGEEFDLGGVLSGLLGEGEGEYEDEDEDEWEGEFEDEAEGMANPLRRVYPDAMMEHLGHAAAEAETEAEAEAFVGALVPLAAGLARKAAPHVARSTPHLVRGLTKVAHTLRRNPTTRQLVRTLPTIASRTTRHLARQVAQGRPVTPSRAVRTLARQTAAVLANPRARRHAVRRARALDRHYHRAARTGQWWTGAMPGGSAAAVRALAPRPAAAGTYARVRYGRPVRYRYGVPGEYGGPAQYRYRYGTPVADGTPVAYRAPARSGAPVRRGPVRRGPAQRVRGYPRGYPRQRSLPPGLSIAWVPVPAWRGSQPPPGAIRY